MKELLKILLVEDNEIMAAVYSRALAKEGFEVDIAHDGQVAIDKINAHGYALVITDLLLPYKHGFDVIRHLQNLSSTPAVIISSFIDAEVFKYAKQLGIQTVLERPVHISALIDAVRQLLPVMPI